MSQMPTKMRCNVLSRLKPIVGIFGQQAIDDFHEPVGNFRVDLADLPRPVFTDPFHDGHRTVRPEGRAAGAHGVENAAEAEQVAAMINLFAARLLGRHKVRSSRDFTGPGNRDVIDNPRQTEIGDFHPFNAVFQHDVTWFHVPVNDSLSMSGSQTVSDLRRDAKNRDDLQRTFGIDLVTQGFAINVFHDQIRDRVPLIDGVNSDHVQIGNRRGRLRLPKKLFAGGRIDSENRGKHLHRDDAI